MESCEVNTDICTQSTLPFQVWITNSNRCGTCSFTIEVSTVVTVSGECLVWIEVDIT